MVLKARKPAEDDAKPARKRRRRDEPLDVQLSVAFRFGEAPEDRVTVIDDRRIPMVGGLLNNRDRIVRGFMKLLLRTAVTQPRVARQLFPLRGVKPRGKKKKP
jgi:hypothetical protein